MNMFISRGAALVGAFLGCVPAWAGCTVFQHRDFQGAHWALGSRHSLQMGGEPIGGTDWRIDYKPAWNDQISSFIVTADCTITLWQHVSTGQMGGSWWGSGAKFVRSGKRVSYVGDRWNDQASWVDCLCRQ